MILMLEAKQVKKNDNEGKTNNEEGFQIDNRGKANWALRKIRHLKKKQSKNDELAKKEIEKLKAEIEEVNEWLKSENESLQNSIDFFKNKLHGYALQLKEDDPDFKTLKLPFGKIQFRNQRKKWHYDNDKLLDFAEKNIKTAVKTKKKVDKRKLKKLIKVVGDKAIIEATGEVVEGIKVEERGEKFKVKVKENK